MIVSAPIGLEVDDATSLSSDFMGVSMIVSAPIGLEVDDATCIASPIMLG